MINKIRLMVKGDEAAARAAMDERGLTGELASVLRTSTCWDVSPSFRSKVVSWSCEPGVCEPESGFPPGTLLFHS